MIYSLVCYLYNSYWWIGHYRDLLTVQGTVILTEAVIMPEPQARALSVLKSKLLSQGQSIYHDNAIYISNHSFYFIEGNKTFKIILLILLQCWLTLTTAQSPLRSQKGTSQLWNLERSLKEKASQFNNCYNSIYCNFVFVNN